MVHPSRVSRRAFHTALTLWSAPPGVERTGWTRMALTRTVATPTPAGTLVGGGRFWGRSRRGGLIRIGWSLGVASARAGRVLIERPTPPPGWPGWYPPGWVQQWLIHLSRAVYHRVG